MNIIKNFRIQLLRGDHYVALCHFRAVNPNVDDWKNPRIVTPWKLDLENEKQRQD